MTENVVLLCALSAGERPEYSGLCRDKHGMVVGSHGVIVLEPARHLPEVLAALTQMLNLAAGVTVETTPPTYYPLHNLVVIESPDRGGMSRLLDAAWEALQTTRSTRHRLYTGDGQMFVPYRASEAPYGYDIRGTMPQLPPGERLLVLPSVLRRLPITQKQSMLDVLLSLPLHHTPLSNLPETSLSVLTDRRMAALVVGYAQRHNMGYAVRFLHWQIGSAVRQAALFDFVSADGSPHLPDTIMHFLQRLPRTKLLCNATPLATLHDEPDRRVLVECQQRPAFFVPHMRDLLPTRSLLVLSTSPWGTALIHPVPPRQPLQHLTAPVTQLPNRGAHTRQHAGPPPRLHLTLEQALSNGTHVVDPVQGLLLDWQAFQRLLRIVRNVPAPLFAHIQIALGDGMALLVTTHPDQTIAGLPLGQPLTRGDVPELLLPRGLRLLPRVSAEMLRAALHLQPATLTVLTRSRRYMVVQTALQPLDSVLTNDAGLQKLSLTVQESNLPPLDMHDLAGNGASAGRVQPAMAAYETASSNTTGQAGVAPAARATLPAESPLESLEHRAGGVLRRLFGTHEARLSRGQFTRLLREEARQLEDDGRYDVAAAFYAYLGDDQQAADCYWRALSQG